MGGDALTAAGEAEPFFGGGLDADAGGVHAAGGGKDLPHLRDVGSQLGTLAQDGGVDVADGVALLGNALNHVL